MGPLIKTRNELIRINPKNRHKIEYSTTQGNTWHTRYCGSCFGDFYFLEENENEILATTSKGLFISKNKGNNWHKIN